ncbi:uncharacterized protein LOC109597556 isoform X2 [Aethina tumida]|uniref:uncharacterized protein LOC109597556 isoform X2 n=1 Tax=Aethina tumida TaxID=116153 RepID=UPI002147ECB6|nr:uncharacterized protein LOC109597556 isoform X2 [Aethina tumida]
MYKVYIMDGLRIALGVIIQIMRRLIIFLVISSSTISNCQESAQYLQNAVRDLRKMNFRQTLRRVDTKMVEEASTIESIKDVIPSKPTIERRVVQKTDQVPPLSLTKGELAALYENAVSKGDTIKLNAGDNSFVHAAVAELDGTESNSNSGSSGNSDDSGGYYYYYYPIKSFIDELSSKQSHNINISHAKGDMEEKKTKAMEPLFMAISGFIGMAVMFVMSIFWFPRLKTTTGGITKKTSKQEKITDIARIALSAIEGQDCTERFACELGKTARSFNLQDNRFMKLLKRMAPSTFGKQIDKVGRYSNKRLKCTAIPCKKKPPKDKNNNKKNQSAQKKS